MSWPAATRRLVSFCPRQLQRCPTASGCFITSLIGSSTGSRGASRCRTRATTRYGWEHPRHGRRVDVVALPLTQTDGIDLFPYDPVNAGPLIVYGPSDLASIV